MFFEVAYLIIACFSDVNSSFVTITLTFSTSQLEPRLRPYINLYLATFFSLPITRLDGSGTKMTFEEVVKGLDDDTLEYEVGLGVGSGFSELISVDLKVERANYGKAIAWLRGKLSCISARRRLACDAYKTTCSRPGVG